MPSSTREQGHTNLLAVVTPNLAAKPDTVHQQQGDDQGREAGRAAVRSRSGRGRPRGRGFGRRRRHPQGPGRRSLHHRRRVHPLGGRGRQEDLRLQLRGREDVDLARPQAASRASTRSSPTRPPRVTRSPAAPRTKAPGGKPLTAQTGESPLAGLRTVVTGASSGIGRAIAVAFAAAGARVGIGFWRSSDAARALADELGGPEHPLLQADLGTLDGCDRDRGRGVRRARAASTSGSTTPAPTCSPARRGRGRPSASSRRCSSST